MWKRSSSHKFFSIHRTTPASPQCWKLDKADWDAFTGLCTDELQYDELSSTPDPIECFSSALLAIADETIPKTSNQPCKKRKPWFNDDCKMAVLDRNTSLQTFSNSATSDNLSNLRIYRAEARRTIKLSKRNYWRSYVSQLRSQTPMKKIWNMVRRISGKPATTSNSHLKVNGTTIEQPT